MQAKEVAGKSLFFVVICLFVALFAEAFGSDNSLAGVIVVLIALMTLGKDMSVSPLRNLAGLAACTMMMCAGAFLSMWTDIAWLGAAVNLVLVFALSYLTTHDLRSPMHFPFLLGYVFLMSVPVEPSDLPVRVAGLLAGCVLIVALNVLVNRNSHARTCRDGIAGLCGSVKGICQTLLDGGTVPGNALDSSCSTLRTRVYDRLRSGFSPRPADRTVLDLVSSLQLLGNAVREGERDPEALRGIMALMDRIVECENGVCGPEDVHADIGSFLERHTHVDHTVRASLKAVSHEFRELDRGEATGARYDLRKRLSSYAREGVRTDSVRFTFAVRMSVVFALCTLAWKMWDQENARWMLFTVVALVLPYVDGAWRKSAMRVSGTLVGIAAVVAVSLLTDGSVGALTVALLAANYVYVLLSPKRYDVMTAFITFSALIVASMASPMGDAALERVLYILVGVAAATAANYLILPYRIRDEDLELGSRYVRTTGEMRSVLLSRLRGEPSSGDMEVLSVTASDISAKMHMNIALVDGQAASTLLSLQDSNAALCSVMDRMSPSVSETCRRRAADVLEGGDPDGASEGLSGDELAFVSAACGVVDGDRRAREELVRMLVGGRPANNI